MGCHVKMDDGSDRKNFHNLPAAENPQFGNDGLEIYMLLKNKYPENNNISLDNILNGLCASIFILMKKHVQRDDYKRFLQLVYKILFKNI